MKVQNKLQESYPKKFPIIPKAQTHARSAHLTYSAIFHPDAPPPRHRNYAMLGTNHQYRADTIENQFQTVPADLTIQNKQSPCDLILNCLPHP